MAGGAAGGFLSRAFESMLKECSFTKKSPDLQKAIQTFQGPLRSPLQISFPFFFVSLSTFFSNVFFSFFQIIARRRMQRLLKTRGNGLEIFKFIKILNSEITPFEFCSSGEIESAGSVNAVLSSAGNTLEGPQAELVLNPLRLAFETKNLKLIEPALDCLHVCMFDCLLLFKVL